MTTGLRRPRESVLVRFGTDPVLLHQRLLLARSTSDGAERIMIGKLKLRCGSQFTGKMVRARRPAFIAASAPSPRRIERASLRSALPLRRVWYSPYAIDAARASRRWRMGGTRRHRRDISTHTSARGRRVDREALTVLYQRRRAC